MRVEIAKRAQRRAEEADAWWRSNRSASPDLFALELNGALELLRDAPRSGAPYPTERRPQLRRLLLPRTRYHLYFVVNETAEVVQILSVWSAVRGRAPRL